MDRNKPTATDQGLPPQARPRKVVHLDNPKASAQAARDDRGTGDPTAVASPRLRICFLEDTPAAGSSILSSLVQCGHQVDRYLTAEDAYQAVLQNRYDVLLASQHMALGRKDCEELISAVRSTAGSERRQLPIVALTNNADRPNVEQLLNLGADQVVTRPLQVNLSDTLTAIVSQCSAMPLLEPVVRQLQVCLLEDSFTHSRSIIQELAARGHHVDHFAAPEEALEAVMRGNYHLLLVSQWEPFAGLDCNSLLRALRTSQDPRKRVLPVVVMASDPAPRNLKAMAAAGADRVMVKPAGPDLADQLIDVVRIKAGRMQQMAGNPGADRRSAEAAAPAVEPPSAEPGTDHVQPAAVAGRRPAAWLPAGNATRALVILLGAAVAGGAGYLGWERFAGGIPVEVVTVRQGTLTKSVNVPGRVASKKQVDLTTPVPGQLAAVEVEEGDKVRKGQVLATLESGEAQVNVRRAEAALANARETVAFAKRALEQTQNAAARGQVSQQMLESADAAMVTAKSREQLAQEELRAARFGLDRLKITAPFSGVITQSYAVEGLWVEPPGALFRLVDISQREIKLTVDHADVRNIAPAQPVAVTSDAYPGLEWQETVTRIDNGAGDSASGWAFVYASLSNDAPDLQYGQEVEVSVVTESSRDVMKLPFEAIINRNGQETVAAVDDGKVRYQPVRLGLEALTETEIVSGVAPGQQIILPRQELAEGQRVETTEVRLANAEAEDGFPLRTEYSDVMLYTTDQLRRNYDDVFVVDVRSRFEYDVVHVAKAVNVPLAADSFAADLEQVRGKDDPTPIVFYCNGHTCAKSYKAARAAAAAGFKYVYAYDSGIFDWTRAVREKTTLLGNTPAPVRKMVSEEYFQSRLVDFAAFKRKAKQSDTVVIDVRDDIQRQTTITLDTVALPLDQFVKRLDTGEFKGKQLLIFDAVGKQVQWLQYILEDRGYKDYFFLRDGIASV